MVSLTEVIEQVTTETSALRAAGGFGMLKGLWVLGNSKG